MECSRIQALASEKFILKGSPFNYIEAFYDKTHTCHALHVED